jgi:hypothetical protein
MQRLIHTLIIVLFIFTANVNAAVLMDEVVSNDAIDKSQNQPNANGLMNALETTHRPLHTDALLTAPLDGYVKAGNEIDSDAIIQEKVTAKPADNESLLLVIAVIGLIFFIMRRRSK